MAEKIIIVGGGGHAKTVIDAIAGLKRYDICGIVDPKLPIGALILGVKVLGGDDKLEEIFSKGISHAFIGVGSIGNCDTRKKIYEALKKSSFKLPVIVHPRAVVASDVEFGEGAFVAAGSVINPGTKIGKNAIINTSTSIDHDCVIGDFVHIAPGVTLSGGVNVGDETHIGTGANVTQYLNIGRKAIIGAGVTVRQNVADGQRYFGRTNTGSHERE